MNHPIIHNIKETKNALGNINTNNSLPENIKHADKALKHAAEVQIGLRDLHNNLKPHGDRILHHAKQLKKGVKTKDLSKIREHAHGLHNSLGEVHKTLVPNSTQYQGGGNKLRRRRSRTRRSRTRRSRTRRSRTRRSRTRRSKSKRK